MMAWHLLLEIWLAAAVMMSLGWLWQRRHDNAGIVDVLWAAGLAGSAVLNAFYGSGTAVSRALVGLLGGIWAARLAGHLWLRVRSEPEDGRYRALRERWNGSQLKWFGLFQFQALLIPLFSVPFAAAAANSSPQILWLAIALGIWNVSVLGESLADHQLARFRADPANRGRTCRVALWRYSRHPNYFFEWLHWFCFVALSMGGPTAWLSLSGPVVMFVFLRWISGVPYTEAQALRTRGEDYRDYQRRTSMLIPWPPRKYEETYMSTAQSVRPAGMPELPRDRFAPGLLGLAERGLIPDALLRSGMRHLCAQRLLEERAGGPAAQTERFQRRLTGLRATEVALHTDTANLQHYELPPEFFAYCLGPRLKYSSAYYPTGRESLAEAEEAMLMLYGHRADLADGQDILELGCGWGSLTLWMAQRYPNARICAVSNSRLQRAHIEARCRERGLRNVTVVTRDVNYLELPAAAFDRCVSIEMFEHMRNYDTLLARIACWLRPRGTLFVHIFAHRTLMYPFETEGGENWLGRHFFTGGLMPAVDTLAWFQRDLLVENQWQLDGTHYQRTANHWLQNQDRHRDEIKAVLRKYYGEPQAQLWFQRWRMFWMACAETFGFEQGQEWVVAHYRLTQRD